MIDTHCHLNFKAFRPEGDRPLGDVISRAKTAGVDQFIVPGTDVETSQKAVEIAEKYPEVYAAVGIHPHHVFEILQQARHRNFLSPVGPLSQPLAGKISQVAKNLVSSLKSLLKNKKVVAIGEVGLDRHYYQKTKYGDYRISSEFMDLQKTLFIEQIKLAIKYKKSLIIHTREAAGETLEIIGDSSILTPLAGHMIFHCCEASDQLLEFALAHRIYIGVDGDVTYSKSKEEFIKKVPLELLVLETDSPFLLPRLRRGFGGQAEPLQKPNEPKNLKIIAEKISEIKKIPEERLIKVFQTNSEAVFGLSSTQDTSR